MDAVERQHLIMALLAERGSLRVADTAEELGVAAVTVRNDVRELAGRGLVRRSHGAFSLADGYPGGGSVAAERLPGRRRTTAVIGMVIPQQAYYFPEIIAGAREAAERSGARLVLEASQNEQAEERALVQRLIDSGVDGLVLSTVQDPEASSPTRTWVRSLSVPVVLCERRSPGEEFVATDHGFGAEEALRHLVATGRSSISLVLLDTVTAPRVRAGFLRAMTDVGLASGAAAVIEVPSERSADLDEVAQRLVTEVAGGRLDAVIIHHDMLSVALVGRVRALGVGIGAELAVVSYDDAVAELSDTPLTAVAPPRREVGARAVELLCRRLAEPEGPIQNVLLLPRLNVRMSTETLNK